MRQNPGARAEAQQDCQQQQQQQQQPEEQLKQEALPQAERQVAQQADRLPDGSSSRSTGHEGGSACSGGTDPTGSCLGGPKEEQDDNSLSEGRQRQQVAASGSLLPSTAPPSSDAQAIEWEAGPSGAVAAPGAAAAEAGGVPAAAVQDATWEHASTAAAVSGQTGVQSGLQEEEGLRQQPHHGSASPTASLQAQADSELPELAAVQATVHALVDACVASAAAGLDRISVDLQQLEMQPLQPQQQELPQPQMQPSASPGQQLDLSPAQQRLSQCGEGIRWWQAAILGPLPPSAAAPPAAAPAGASPAVSTQSAAPAAPAADAGACTAHAALLPEASGGAAPAGGDGQAAGSADAAAIAGAAAASSAAAAAQAGPAGAAEGDPMPDPGDSVAMMHWLRARIPQHLLDEYREPFQISEEEKAVTEQRLAEYEAEVKRAIDTRRVKQKFDLNAASLMPALHPEWGLWEPTYGHKPGTWPGQPFSGRGPLQALGVHANYYGGIHSSKEDPAFAICLSGGYEDDEDHGDWLWYTGMGGQKDGVQVESQEFKGPNAAIRACMEQGKPLRVCRGLYVETTQVNPKTGREKVVKRLQYTYDGLYAVVRADLCNSYGSKRKPVKVCRYLMVGIPGHYKSNRSISFVELRGFRNMRLAAARPGTSEDDSEEGEEGEEEEIVPDDDWRRYPKRRRTTVHQAAAGAASSAAAAAAAAAPRRKQKRQAGRDMQAAPAAPAVVVQDDAWLAAQRARPGFLTADISGGAEARKIPAFNEVDDVTLDELQYVRDSTIGSEAARTLADAARALMPASWCGRKQNRSKAATWTPNSLMDATCYFGLWECCRDKGVCSAKCRTNCVISDRGIHQPLEVFRTRWKGWGLRCTVDLEPGAFVATYEGEVITTAEAEERRDGDGYLFDLEHFVLMHKDPSIVARGHKGRLPPLPAGCEKDEEHLVIDARRVGELLLLPGDRASEKGLRSSSPWPVSVCFRARTYASLLRACSAPHLQLWLLDAAHLWLQCCSRPPPPPAMLPRRQRRPLHQPLVRAQPVGPAGAAPRRQWPQVWRGAGGPEAHQGGPGADVRL
ncbi:hypothetical protein ABPG77_005167 [Micractinium sp. CCAP 211/92]